MENELNKMTAVEWLWEQIDEILPFSVDTETGIKLYNAKEQAKEMDKEQQKYFFDCGRQYQLTGEGTFKEVWDETYGGNK
jgi:hypothetical protein